MNWLRHPLGKLAAKVIGVLTLHAVLLWWLAERDLGALLLSPGSHSPRGALLLVQAFLALRILVVLLLPGSALAQLSLYFLKRWKTGQDRQELLPD